MPALEPYRIGRLFTHENGHFGTISVTERSSAAPISKVVSELHIGKVLTLYRIDFAPARKPYRIGHLFAHKNGHFGAISVTERSCAAPISKVESYISERCSRYTG